MLDGDDDSGDAGWRRRLSMDDGGATRTRMRARAGTMTMMGMGMRMRIRARRGMRFGMMDCNAGDGRGKWVMMDDGS